MVISYQWLLEYLPEPLPVNELSRILTSIGLEVEAVEKAETIKGGLEGLVIGEVLTCVKHPNADKLSVTTVNTGTGEPLHIVCGAPNVAAGQKVVVAAVGTTVYPTSGEPFLIKKAKIRGEESAGMICAEDEIGLGSSHAGIMILPDEAVIGTLAKDYFRIPATDYAIHIGLTPNRSDAMSHIGVARDVCAYLSHHNNKNYKVNLPLVGFPDKKNNKAEITVSLQAENACHRYTGISLKNIRVAPSPEWLQERLKTIEVRPINNIVDITNYVLHEFGQPLHAFDTDKLQGGEINVRFMPEGSQFTGLDSKERKLQNDDLMICDAAGPVAMGGVFGGQYSGISDGTTNVFLESAYFTPSYIRRSSLHHNLRTDAATHFEKGVDINNIIPALLRATDLIQQLAGGETASDVVDVYPEPINQKTVEVTYRYIRKLSGKDYSTESIKNILQGLGFIIEEETDKELTLLVPSNKTDVSQPADIVEEILRIDGLDNIEIPNRLNISLVKALPNDREQREKVAGILYGLGFQEIVTNSIVNSKFYPERTDLVRMLNSLSNDLDVMRPSMLESGLEVIAYNANRRNQNLKLFEFGKVYTQPESKYMEEAQVGIWISGITEAANWNSQAINASVFYTKGLIDNLMQHSGIKNAGTVYDDKDGKISISWKWKNQFIASAEQVPQARLQEFEVKQDVYYISINWAGWLKAMIADKIRYSEVPKYPAVQRDLALVLDSATTYQQVQQVTEQLKADALRSFDLFDVFESEKLGPGKKSYALNYTFQLHDRTLTDAETDQLMKQLIHEYKTKLQAQIRE